MSGAISAQRFPPTSKGATRGVVVMSDHMQPEITEKMQGWQIETRDAGTCYIPGSVFPVPDFLTVGQPVDSTYGLVFDAILADLRDYIPALHVESIEVCRGYFARLSAPGYMDCTEWECHSTIHGARESLRE